MSFIFRKIRTAKWYKNENVAWLPTGALQADALGDLETNSNALSIWRIEADLSNLRRVITALAAMGDNVSNVDYALLDEGRFRSMGLNTRPQPGETPDHDANHWHIDLVELTADNLLQFAKLIQSSGQIERVPEKKVKQWLRDGVANGQLDRSKMGSSILTKLEV